MKGEKDSRLFDPRAKESVVAAAIDEHLLEV